MPRLDRFTTMVALSAGIALAACNSQDATVEAGTMGDSATGTELARWVGQVEGDEARVGAVTDGTRAQLFFCGGAESYATATRWFNLDISDGEIQFQDSAWQLRAHITRNGIVGAVQREDGMLHLFSADPVAPSTIAGLYEGTDDCGRLGLIVVQPNKKAAPIGQGACVGKDHAPEQVNPILPIAQEMGLVRVQSPGGDDSTALLHPLELPPLSAAN